MNLKLVFEDERHEKQYGDVLRMAFPGKRYPDLSQDERREYRRVWRQLNAERLSNARKQSRRVRVYSEAERQQKREYDRRYKAQNAHKFPAYYRRYRLKREYGLSLEQYDAMVKAQRGKCAICCNGEIGRKGDKKLFVDHCHKTGRVRQLLCHHCNMLLGHSDDDPVMLRKAAQYLERHAKS